MERNDRILINSAQLEEKYVNFHCGTWTEGRNYVYVVIINVYNAQCHREPVRHV